MYASSVSFLKNLIHQVNLVVKEISSNELILGMFDDLINKIEEYINLARDRIYNMYYKK